MKNHPKYIQNNSKLPIILLVIFIFVSNFITYIVTKPNNEEDPGVAYRAKYSLIDPTRRLEDPADLITNIQPLREYLKALPEQNKDWAEMSIYFEYLKTGANITVNPDLKIWPASLAKLPVAMITMRRIERGDWSLDTMIKMEEEDADILTTPDIVKEIGRSYDIKFLLERLLLESDNTAYRMLAKNFPDEDINSIGKEVGLEELLIKGGKISAKDYTRLLRVLYVASYINEGHSQFLLSLMQDSEYRGLIRGGLPQDVLFTHKWGTNEAYQVYSDSGIVYVENRPYMISVMIQAKNGTQKESSIKVDGLMKEIGQRTYEYVSNY